MHRFIFLTNILLYFFKIQSYTLIIIPIVLYIEKHNPRNHQIQLTWHQSNCIWSLRNWIYNWEVQVPKKILTYTRKWILSCSPCDVETKNEIHFVGYRVCKDKKGWHCAVCRANMKPQIYMKGDLSFSWSKKQLLIYIFQISS